MNLQHILLFVNAVLIAGCANNMPETASGNTEVTFNETVGTSNGFDSFIEENLLAQYNEWKGTPYRYNGLSNAGIDCSGFMYITFKSQFGIEMPRSTDQQAKLGDTIDKSELRSGDLVFFKTGFSSRHVGVYLSDSKFLHASTKRGVIISSLESKYWRSSYWISKRILQ